MALNMYFDYYKQKRILVLLLFSPLPIKNHCIATRNCTTGVYCPKSVSNNDVLVNAKLYVALVKPLTDQAVYIHF